MSNERGYNGDTQNGHRGARWKRTETTDALVHGTCDGTHHSHPQSASGKYHRRHLTLEQIVASTEHCLTILPPLLLLLAQEV